jgi:peptidoglycan/LPS O-acetylase OafA/YrhL
MLATNGPPTARRLSGLDGLRAAAVLLVIADHLFPNFAGGGIGVNLFFVLSGFLITTLLVAERHKTGRIHLGLFYLRRLLRLYPALIVMVVVVVAVTHALLAGVFAATYTANLAGLVGFTPDPFGHTWSLAAEEQFYLVWPLALIGLFRHRRLLIGIVVVAALVSFVTCVVGTAQLVSTTGQVGYIVFNPLWQAHGLLIGVLLALVTGTFSRASFSLPKPNLWVLGGALAVLVIAVIASVTVGQHLAAEWDLAAEIVAGVLILGLVECTGRLRRAVDHPVALWVGARSYALYLWHYPIFSILEQYHLGTIRTALIGLPATFIIAWVSGRWIEAPFLRLKDRLHAPPPVGGTADGSTVATAQ